MFSISSMSQPNSDRAILERLYQAELVSSYERKELLKEIKWKEDWNKKHKEVAYDDSEERSDPHYPLRLLQLAKVYSTPGVSSAIFTPDKVVIPKGKEKYTRDKLTLYSNKLLKAKLISKVTFDELSAHIKDLSLRSEYEVTEVALRSTEQEYFLAPAKLKAFAKTLLERQLINQQKFDEMMERSAKGSFRNYREPLSYVDRIVWIDLKDYSGGPEEYLEKFYRKVAGAFPSLSFDKLGYTIQKNERESSTELVFYDITVTLQKEGKKFSYTSHWDAKSPKLPKELYVNIPEQFQQVFNKMLADQGSPYRLHIVNAHMLRNTEHFGVLALKRDQFGGLQWSYGGQIGQYLTVSYENFNNKLTQSRIKQAITVFDSLGLFSHLQRKDIDSAIAAIESAEINYYSDILLHFKNLVFEIDLEYGVEEKQYEELIKMLAGISKGAFNPVNIIDNYNPDSKKPFDVGFMLNGKQYQAKLKQEDDWIDPGFFMFIDNALADQHKKGKFYTLYPSDGIRLIHLTHEQAEQLKAKKMIELSEEDLN